MLFFFFVIISLGSCWFAGLLFGFAPSLLRLFSFSRTSRRKKGIRGRDSESRFPWLLSSSLFFFCLGPPRNMCVSCSFSPLVVGRWRERLKRETRKRATKTQTFLRVIHDFPFYLYVCCWMNVGLSGLQWGGGGNIRKMPRRRRRTTTKQKQKKARLTSALVQHNDLSLTTFWTCCLVSE